MAAERSRTSERLALVFLVVAAGVLAYVRFAVVPSRGEAGDDTFDVSNPMLDAEDGQCVEIESTTQPGEVACLEVVAPGVVLRPASGPDTLGDLANLRREPPYLASRLSHPPAGKGCAAMGHARQAFWERFDLNGFGLPSSVPASLQSLRPVWIRRGDRYHFVYEAQMMRYGDHGGIWTHYISPEAPVTGVVFRQHSSTPRRVEDTVFRPCGTLR